ncbi:MAG TPA: tRNA lysidine(34) synthetase TilS [Anaeromyxobacter sp.]|nr:tRNA lysidine(34) synthetase TilS [Anaeromyxobacter sp.]
MRKNRPDSYPAAVLDTARRRRLFGPADRVLVALSAGPDSTALLAALAALREGGHLGAVAALHVDHGLRPGGAEDAACAREACERLGVGFESVAVRVAPGNVQAAARRARYAALRETAARLGATRIATGHTRGDQAETVLLRLLRGAGARGLSGIPPRRGIIVRPLIDRGRGEGIAYLRAIGIAWREDPTNATPRYARNRIRHEALPALRAVAPAAERVLARAADLARADERALVARARAALGAGGGAALASLAAEPAAVRRRIVRLLWRRAGGRRLLGAGHVEAVLALARRRRPGRVTLPGGIEARVRYGGLELGWPVAPPAPLGERVVPGPGRYPLPERGLALEVAAARAEAVPWPVVARARRPGDRFHPEGAAGGKKLKAWLIDRKVPREARDALVVLASGRAVLAIPALGVVAAGMGPGGAGLDVRVAALS